VAPATSRDAARESAQGDDMSRYIKTPRPEPTSEEFIALAILLGPLAWVVRWIWLRWNGR
jgi:hypothetical protein